MAAALQGELLNTEAVVLKGFDWSETSRIVHLISPEHGRIHALARGVHRRSSPLFGVLDHLYQIETELRRAPGRDLYSLRQARLLEHHPGLRTDLARWYAALYVGELIEAVVQPEIPCEELYATFTACLTALGHEEACGASILVAFELRFLDSIGLTPSLAACTQCGRSYDPTRSRVAMFSPALGGVVCGSCRSEMRKGGQDALASAALANNARWRRVPITYLQQAQSLLAADTPQTALAQLLPQRSRAVLRPLLDEFLSYQLEREFRSRRYLRW